MTCWITRVGLRRARLTDRGSPGAFCGMRVISRYVTSTICTGGTRSLVHGQSVRRASEARRGYNPAADSVPRDVRRNLQGHRVPVTDQYDGIADRAGRGADWKRGSITDKPA